LMSRGEQALNDVPEWTRDRKRKGDWWVNAGRKLIGG
jgi:hypothetical protein